MARILLAPCSQPGCPRLVRRRGKCSQHQSDRSGTAIYNTRRWRRLQSLVRAQEPLCRACLVRGEVSLSTEVDHVKPINSGGAPWDPQNLQALCRSCHSAKTRREMGREGAEKTFGSPGGGPK
ncbi:MAG: HNH endonuclease, partial [Rhodospirillaceae bacterium]